MNEIEIYAAKDEEAKELNKQGGAAQLRYLNSNVVSHLVSREDKKEILDGAVNELHSRCIEDAETLRMVLRDFLERKGVFYQMSLISEQDLDEAVKEYKTMEAEVLARTMITSLARLQELTSEEDIDVHIRLTGGLISRKRIGNWGVNKWYVLNLIDDTEQTLNDEELWTLSNIGEAMDKGALFWEPEE